MAMGAYQALLAAGKAEEVKVFGFDGADDVVKAVAEGKIAATVMPFPKTMARSAAENADKYFKGERNFPQRTPVAARAREPRHRRQVRRLRSQVIRGRLRRQQSPSRTVRRFGRSS